MHPENQELHGLIRWSGIFLPSRVAYKEFSLDIINSRQPLLSQHNPTKGVT